MNWFSLCFLYFPLWLILGGGPAEGLQKEVIGPEGSGTAGVRGVISSANSLVGSAAQDRVGHGGVTVLAKGNYVVRSSYWKNAAGVRVGAVTWGGSLAGVSGVVSAANSLVGSMAFDGVGREPVVPLPNGHAVVVTPEWNRARGAVTWMPGNTGITGFIDAGNSLVGTSFYDGVGSGGVTVLPNSNYAVRTLLWNNGEIRMAGAITLAQGATGLTGPIFEGNSVLGVIPLYGHHLTLSVDPPTNRVLVGHKSSNRFSVIFSPAGQLPQPEPVAGISLQSNYNIIIPNNDSTPNPVDGTDMGGTASRSPRWIKKASSSG